MTPRPSARLERCSARHGRRRRAAGWHDRHEHLQMYQARRKQAAPAGKCEGFDAETRAEAHLAMF